MRCATSCWLVFALAATTALAQTHPKKKPVRKPATVQQPQRESQDTYEDFTQGGEQSQPAPLDAKVYFYVEQMPLLNGQQAYLASSAAISRAVVVPAAAPAGRVYVQFIVTKEGQVSHPHIVKGLRADLDSAVVAATRQLPHFTPGKQANRVVAVSITVGVTFPVAQQP
jgi:hypothetical protein